MMMMMMMMVKSCEASKWQESLSQAGLCRDAAAIGSLMVPFDDRADHHDGNDDDCDDDYDDDGDDDDDDDDDPWHISKRPYCVNLRVLLHMPFVQLTS